MFKNIYIFLFFFLFIGLQWCFSQDVPPIIKADGDQIYCPSSQIPITTFFDIDHASDTATLNLFIQISTGYVRGQDELRLSGTHPNIRDSCDATQGKLTLSGVNGALISFPDLKAAVKNVVFENNSLAVSGDRTFSFTIGNANYLPFTGHYYEYVEVLGITWHDAKTAASQRTYYGRQGYLATITSQEESQLAGEQAAGAGWIGGSDEDVEGEWKWVTGPETGVVFWRGDFRGYSPSGQYANWNAMEPNNGAGDEHYAHITSPQMGVRGTWNDMRNIGGSGVYLPRGYIVEYGGMPGDSETDITAFTKITVNTIFQDVSLPEDIPVFSECDTDEDGDATNGRTEFDLTAYKKLLVDRSSSSNFLIDYYKDSHYTAQIPDPAAFINTVPDGQTIYVQIYNSIDRDCFRAASFLLQVDKLPIAPNSITYKNCDADGVSDGFTDFNLNEIDVLLNPSHLPDLEISYHLSMQQAEDNEDSLNPSIFNNATASTIYARVQNANSCSIFLTINLQVSTTSFPVDYLQELPACDDDDTNDGYHMFDLTAADTEFLAQFPIEQNLSVHYYKNLLDAQLNQNEIQETSSYINEFQFSEVIYVRIQSEDNGDCFGVGPYLKLIVNPLPEFEVDQSETFCLNGGSIVLNTYNPKGSYSYIWTDQANKIVSVESTATVTEDGTYTVIAKSTEGCESFPVEFTVLASGIANLTDADISIEEFSDANTISIDTRSLGIGDYEFSLENADGIYREYQNEPIFNNVPAGVYTLYVNDKKGCGTATLVIYVMGLPKYFTPNNDGVNDTWNIKGFASQFSHKSYTEIYDRYGLFLARIRINDEGWDGSYNGEPLPANDYWYVSYFIDNQGQPRSFRGHFSLKR